MNATDGAGTASCFTGAADDSSATFPVSARSRRASSCSARGATDLANSFDLTRLSAADAACSPTVTAAGGVDLGDSAGGGAIDGCVRAIRFVSDDNAVVPERSSVGDTEIQSATAVAAAAAGTSHLIPRLAGHQDRGATGGSVRAIADRTAWHRAQPAACPSAAARRSAGSAPSIHAATVSASRQLAASGTAPSRSARGSRRCTDRSAAPSGDCPADALGRSSFTSSSSYRTIGLHILAGDIVEVQRARVFQGVFEAPGDLVVAKPCFPAEVPLNRLAQLATGSRQLP